MNLSEMVDRAASDRPDHPAIVFEDLTISYGDLLRSINQLSNALVKSGIGKGDRVAVIMGNRPEFVMAYFAAVRIGAIAVTLNPVSTVHELSHYFTESKPSAVVCKPEQVPKLQALQEQAQYVKAIITTEPAEGAISLNDIRNDFSDQFTAADMQPDDPAVVIFTAGLLGRALGASLSHGNLDSNSIMLEQQCNGNHEHHGLAIIPMFHAFGAAVNLLNIFRVAATTHLVERVDFPTLIPGLQ